MHRFQEVATGPGRPRWPQAVSREGPLYDRPDDPRPPFWRDYNRLLHCRAYRRLKHKTQVFFAPRNDHVCTRIEHVNHVAAVSETIASSLGLDTVLTRAIAVGHDIGHAPFGHEGERVLNRLIEARGGEPFWHERNSLWFADRLETLEDPSGHARNLRLTYAVRDGIVCHCGEIDAPVLAPRDEPLDLYTIPGAGQVEPFTWEGCVVKLADKIAYVGRDLEDARTLGILDETQEGELRDILAELSGDGDDVTNTTLLHLFIIDLCQGSSPEAGLCLSPGHHRLLLRLKAYSSRHIYGNQRLGYFKEYARLILESLFDLLLRQYDGPRTLQRMHDARRLFPRFMGVFADWLVQYAGADEEERAARLWANDRVYDLARERDYVRCAADFLSGMTDSFAIRAFDEVTAF